MIKFPPPSELLPPDRSGPVKPILLRIIAILATASGGLMLLSTLCVLSTINLPPDSQQMTAEVFKVMRTDPLMRATTSVKLAAVFTMGAFFVFGGFGTLNLKLTGRRVLVFGLCIGILACIVQPIYDARWGQAQFVRAIREAGITSSTQPADQPSHFLLFAVPTLFVLLQAGALYYHTRPAVVALFEPAPRR